MNIILSWKSERVLNTFANFCYALTFNFTTNYLNLTFKSYFLRVEKNSMFVNKKYERKG